MVVTIHQPEHLPWLGFFDKVHQADLLVLLDHVQYRKNYFQNRNRIRGQKDAVWLTVPVLTKGKSGQGIHEVRINNQGSPRWRQKCWASLEQSYQRADFWDDYRAFIESVYQRDWDSLADLNEYLIRYLLDVLSIDVKVMKSSDMDVAGQRGDLLLEICLETRAEVYMSGISGREYLDPEPFEDAGIEVRFQMFHHPIHQQCYKPFMPCMSAVDLLFNHGSNSLDVIKGIGVEIIDHVFE